MLSRLISSDTLKTIKLVRPFATFDMPPSPKDPKKETRVNAECIMKNHSNPVDDTKYQDIKEGIRHGLYS
jgi:hypothetical protein